MTAKAVRLGFAIFAPFLSTAVLSLAYQPAQPFAYATVRQASEQAGAPAPPNDSTKSDLAPGTTICVALATTIDAKKANPGQLIFARVTLPVLGKGKVILPNDAKIMGHVVSARPRSQDGDESEVAIVFDHAVVKRGTQMPLALTVQAIGRSTMSAEEIADQQARTRGPFGAGSSQASNSTTRQPNMVPPPMPREDPDPGPPGPVTPGLNGGQHPALDTGSHGTVGLPDLTLTESADATTGSLVRAKKKDVKLESGTEMILRVLDVRSDKSKAKY
jgi:hypothetical protein